MVHVETREFGRAIGLSCRECGALEKLGPIFACSQCFGPLEVAYDFGEISREEIVSGPPNIWRYRALLPVPPDVAEKPNLAPGWTKLVKADRLAAELGLRSLYVKDDSGNPTHSFKDRVVAIAVEAARAFGFRTLSCSSTGNLAGAVAAAATRAGLDSCVFIPADLEAAKIVMAAVYGGRIVGVEGSYDDVNRLCSELLGDPLGEKWGFVNVNLRPYYAEGSKTLAYEIAEQLGWRLPDQIVIPVASGSQLTKIDKGFRELIKLGLVEDKPYRVFGAQATGCAPVARAFKAGHDVVQPVKPDTIVKSLAIGNPADGPYVLDVVRRTSGAVEDVDDHEVVEAIRLLARTEGIFAETAGGVTVGVLRKLLRDGRLDPDAETVVLNTGDGLKTLDVVAGQARPTAVIRPSLDALRTAFAN
ncbi:threonine synthase [Thermobispora bispora]|uniref:Threonine synthase n=1 Tax=Thermobispora bispora (strain ATCC 19993 / DSM 43833 / CBS 139.67 / JCM 10125 / KCTC 9307 / NBRC 14880 / R51) TaxID=469371 RepID=D6Y929_THEBD|nr:threonine synthase [Thermobispora bispora]MBO2475784.1 threonine synthase [Actinomycetales bacterium]MDI9580393.1 threonine synthase [Thermobispora sp.]ADG89991.1 threonine synthase [Thermobispora bispora DSM 43833]MBX6167263.1 threonine synthase [Thermobispora bispora]QSI46450.1 threonine synthase [Thermobispora bispora]